MRITSTGQVTIPMAIREQLGLVTNTEVEFSVDRGGVRIVKAKTPGVRSAGGQLAEHMRGRATSGTTTDEIVRLLRD
jgi:antitoxin PrlF